MAFSFDSSPPLQGERPSDRIREIFKFCRSEPQSEFGIGEGIFQGIPFSFSLFSTRDEVGECHVFTVPSRLPKHKGTFFDLESNLEIHLDVNYSLGSSSLSDPTQTILSHDISDVHEYAHIHNVCSESYRSLCNSRLVMPPEKFGTFLMNLAVNYTDLLRVHRTNLVDVSSRYYSARDSINLTEYRVLTGRDSWYTNFGFISDLSEEEILERERSRVKLREKKICSLPSSVPRPLTYSTNETVEQYLPRLFSFNPKKADLFLLAFARVNTKLYRAAFRMQRMVRYLPSHLRRR